MSLNLQIGLGEQKERRFSSRAPPSAMCRLNTAFTLEATRRKISIKLVNVKRSCLRDIKLLRMRTRRSNLVAKQPHRARQSRINKAPVVEVSVQCNQDVVAAPVGVEARKTSAVVRHGRQDQALEKTRICG